MLPRNFASLAALFALFCGAIAFKGEQFAVRLREDSNPDQLAEVHGCANRGSIANLTGYFLFERLPVSHRRRSLESLTGGPLDFGANPDVHWFEQQTRRQLYHRYAVPLDPRYAEQWHLHDNAMSINVEDVWRRGVAGKGITIGVVDDGLQYTHPDLADNYNAEGSYDFNSDDADPMPHAENGDDHGTSAAGVAAARANGVGQAAYCGVGAAFHAQVSGIRLISEATTDHQEAAAIAYRTDVNDIYTNSWGPTDDGKRLEGPGHLASLSMKRAIEEGRDGKGSIYIWAGGNGRSYGDNCNYDGWANSRYTITVAAADHLGRQAWYSESCSMLLVTAPSSGNLQSVTTTDLMGAEGKNPGDCTTSFGGTSAAAPLVAGVAALILEANPALGWRDVQHVFAHSSRPIDLADGNWQTNGAGSQVSHKYGFGLVDASAAVELAKTWTNVPPVTFVDSEKIVEDKDISEGSAPGQALIVSHTIEHSVTIEHIEVYVDIAHPHRGELMIALVSPAGTRSVLAEPRADTGADYKQWRFGSVMCWGEISAGDWKLEVLDQKVGNVGVLRSWQLKLFGTARATSPVAATIIPSSAPSAPSTA